VAEKGDRGHNRYRPKRGAGLLCPFRGESWVPVPSNTTWPGRGLLPYQVASSSIQPFGHNRHEPITRGCAPFRGGAAGTPSNTTSHGPRPNSVPSGILTIQSFGHNRHGPRIRGLCPFFLGGELGPHLAQCGVGRGLPVVGCMVQRYNVGLWPACFRCPALDL